MKITTNNPFEQHFSRNPNRLHSQRPQSQLNQRFQKLNKRITNMMIPKVCQTLLSSQSQRLRRNLRTKGPKVPVRGKVKRRARTSQRRRKVQTKPKAKANVLRLFFPKGTCNRGENCPFVHEHSQRLLRRQSRQLSQKPLWHSLWVRLEFLRARLQKSINMIRVA